MEDELQTLEDSLGRFIQLCQHLKAENRELRQELAQAHSNARQLKDSMLVASDRLQSIMQKLPEEML
jgi:cell division protein ZapB